MPSKRVWFLTGQLAVILLTTFSSSVTTDDEDQEKDWWLENATNQTNFTELCSGMMDMNSSEPISSYPKNSSYGNRELI